MIKLFFIILQDKLNGFSNLKDLLISSYAPFNLIYSLF